MLSSLKVQEIVEKRGGKSPRQRADPENTVISPMGGSKGGPKGACRIESPACKWSGDNYPEGIHETGTKASDGTERSAIIQRGGEDGEHQEKGGGGFEGHARPAWKIASELRSAERHRSPSVLWNDGTQQKRGCNCARQLGNPIKNNVDRCLGSGDPVANGYGGIKVTAGNVTESGDHDGER